MKKYGLNQLREMYLSFFESKGHLRMDSFSLVPKDDPSLLLINAGMAPLKPYFTKAKQPPNDRVTTCQKCIRTPDIENVGKTARHGTFFEMLGNFSFGDYFKKEAIAWAWEFFVDVVGFDVNELYVSVYEEDQEAYDIWHNEIGLSEERIVRMGKEDNFWEHGLGPCGPCSEIYVDRGEKYGCGSKDCKVGCECDRYIEVWNLVFTQFDKKENGDYEPLPSPNIDTGMGLERLAVVCQGVDNLFEVDTVKGIIDKICEYTNKKYGQSIDDDVSIRVITDHIRGTTHMISDGILPSNEGRGYVLRRLLRRASRHARLLGVKDIILPKLALDVIELSKDAYPALIEKKDYIHKVITVESEKFNQTIDQGMALLTDLILDAKDAKLDKLSGEEAFRLHDTFGFPISLTVEIAKEEGLMVDIDTFESCMKKQKEMAREAFKNKDTAWGGEDSMSEFVKGISCEFIGYDTMIGEGSALKVEYNEEGTIVIFDKTPFYAKSGGQVSDNGYVMTNDGVKINVIDVEKVDGVFVHYLEKTDAIKENEIYNLVVDKEKRVATMRNHTSTHVLQQALIDVLGEHVQQKGSYVDSQRLRFDFSHFEALTKEEVLKVEEIVNNKIYEALDVVTEEMDIKSAKEKGAKALFDEKYSMNVRVVSVGDYSMELCGGTHLDNLAKAGMFKIVQEGAIASGVRRIEAITGLNALSYFRDKEDHLQNVANVLRVNEEDIDKKCTSLQIQIKQAEDEISELKKKLVKNAMDDILNSVIEIAYVKVLAYAFKDLDMQSLRDTSDQLKDKLGECVLVLAGIKDGKVYFNIATTDKLVKQGIHAGKMIKEVASIAGGGGGGRPNMAQAGAKNPQKVNEALEKGVSLVREILEG